MPVITIQTRHDQMQPYNVRIMYKPPSSPLLPGYAFRYLYTNRLAGMEHWADVSMTSQMPIFSLDDVATPIAANAIEAQCPMCRTSTTAKLNSGLEGTLRSRYPSTYSSRQVEETLSTDEALIETVTLYIGNTHRLKASDNSESSNIHEWSFFVRPSRTDFMEGSAHLCPSNI